MVASNLDTDRGWSFSKAILKKSHFAREICSPQRPKDISRPLQSDDRPSSGANPLSCDHLMRSSVSVKTWSRGKVLH
jgi:hypothetical protein